MKLGVGWIGSCVVLAGMLAMGLETFATAQEKPSELPRIEEKNGRFALIVDGQPYLMLGVQANNSSAWPAYLDKVWDAAETLHANTVELPVYWEQVEAQQGKFDFSLVDLMLKQARERKFRLVLLWFGTWKNGSSHYTPAWIKSDQKKYPFVRNEKGETVDSPSTFSPERLAADKTAFAALMRHLKQADPAHTVLMVQVENEAGVWGAARDHGAEAEKAFAGPVPEKLLKLYGKQAGSWAAVFGDDADELFQAWHTASYIGEVAAAGKAEYALPLYTNVSLRDPLNPGRPPKYESAGPTDNVIGLYKVAAPALSVEAPDIYLPEYAKYTKVMELYKRENNPLFIPETGGSPAFARYVFAAIGQGAIGWSPFGLDLTRHLAPTDAAEGREAEWKEPTFLKPVAQEYALLAPIAGKLAHWSFEGKLQGVSEDPDNHEQTLAFDKWKAVIRYGTPSRADRTGANGNNPPDGGVIVVELAPDEFLVLGRHARVDFAPVNPDSAKQETGKRLFVSVEEVEPTPENGWKMLRIWNGDQTDWGLNLAEGDAILRVKLGTF